MAYCPNGHENPEHDQYCGECGAPLAATNPGARIEMLDEPSADAPDPATTESAGEQPRNDRSAAPSVERLPS